MKSTTTIPVLENRRILLGVCGSIAVYKAADLASMLTQAGVLVDVILSDAAQRFITPLTFLSVTGRHAYTDADLWGAEAHVVHVGLSEAADLFVVAPVTAHTMAKLAQGHADSLLTITALATERPLLLAPAMDAGMFSHPATQANLGVLRDRGAVIVGPVEGHMASGAVGFGRMVEPEELLGHIRLVLGRHGPLSDRNVLVTAGGTHEPIDPVRAITNRSSGKQGFALAQAAIDRGAAVTLITGPTHLQTPIGVQRIDIRTAKEMADAVLSHVEGVDALLMAAAVADFRPEQPKESKIKRRKGTPKLTLKPTEDILEKVAKGRQQNGWPRVVVGFVAESQDLSANAKAKREEKDLSMVVANDITAEDAGFEVDTNRVILVHEDGGIEEQPLMTKAEVAEVVLNCVVRLLS
jgi:phosphopantothenoylcysteine decarboxylase/phosphopantothenate--cysteine ligase